MRVVMESVEVVMNARRYQMSDRYLFKAKRRNWKEFPKEQWWVEGYYCKRKTGHYTDAGYQEEYRDCIIAEFSDGGISWCDIDPSTICQCTGREDEWEHDIFICEGETYEILFCEGYLTWIAASVFSPESIDLGEFRQKDYVRVGNAIDNPELLEVEK